MTHLALLAGATVTSPRPPAPVVPGLPTLRCTVTVAGAPLLTVWCTTQARTADPRSYVDRWEARAETPAAGDAALGRAWWCGAEGWETVHHYLGTVLGLAIGGLP